ncbi:Zn-dependent hydrolase [Sinimarinibacterium sp. CAU 1509]|uniref:dipeptidyl-peptidase 3 family protein n=1 Tax=Sinimarinibacterium sp. CAU 1509 TaxID=2562283 RepID=UPI0010AD6697|nr:Zn-dependent hydrolase [Sinimarinibacterium sp. CAU 1509]TJY59761.1 Zn-dependent hydrolase [Sinimarinibacterium sp. CAU 1509]
MRPLLVAALATSALALSACNSRDKADSNAQTAQPPATEATPAAAPNYAQQHAGDYATVQLTAKLDGLSDNQRKMLPLLIQAAQTMDEIFWLQAWGERDALLGTIKDPALRELADINYGPWDRLNEDHPFIDGVGPRPPAAQLYPQDMSKAEFEAADLADKTGLYTLLRRDADGKLITVPYHEAYAAPIKQAADLLRQAAALAEDAGFKRYLELRADALLSDDYRPSDMAWMDMKTNRLDLVIGPIETYEDQLYGYKAAYEAYVLVKDVAWSERLARFAQYLPELQRGLPVPDAYKQETPGSDADLNAYEAVYYAGDANVGAKTIAINLPNDEVVQLEKGSRRLQLENVMQAKFDRILMPIARELIADDQLKHLSFDAFFQNTMFHEVAHGLGIKNTLNDRGTVREALKEYASSFEEGKADILGLYMVTKLAQKGELDADKLMDNYVTFMAGIFRSVRFGASDAHGKANMLRFNFFREHGAFERDAETGRYRVNFEKMQLAMKDLSARLLTIQGDGDFDAAKQMTDTLGIVDDSLAGDLKRLSQAKIPVDIRFEQGASVLGL